MTYTPRTVETIIDAKGDLVVGTADNTGTRLAVGGNDAVLIADSTATEGVRWVSAVTTLIKWGLV